jgi:hypothetical protein
MSTARPLTKAELQQLERMADALTPARDMVLRDHIAVATLQAMITRQYYHAHEAAPLAYAYADAMLKAREVKP